MHSLGVRLNAPHSLQGIGDVFLTQLGCAHQLSVAIQKRDVEQLHQALLRVDRAAIVNVVKQVDGITERRGARKKGKGRRVTNN